MPRVGLRSLRLGLY